MQIIIEITKDDEIALNKYSLKKEKSLGSKAFLLIVSFLVIIGVIFIIKSGIENKTDPMVLLCVVLAILLILAFYISLPLLLSKVSTIINIIVMKIMPSRSAPKADKRSYKITDEGLYGESQYGEVLFAWDKIKFIDENKTHIFISSEKYGIHIIPKRYFGSPSESAEFVNIIKTRMPG